VDPRRHDPDRARRHVLDAPLLELVANGRLDATPFATHRFPLGETMAAYHTFAAAAETNALKVVLEAESTQQDLLEHERAAIGA
jgi:hypothetical protein